MSKRLKDLPGFDDCLAKAMSMIPGIDYETFWSVLPDCVLPRVTRVVSPALLFKLAKLADDFQYEYEHQRSHLRLVPACPPTIPVPANDCEAL